MNSNMDRLHVLAEPLASQLGLRVYHIELAGSGSHRVLRVFIDRADREKVTLEDCSLFSKAIGEKLDAEDYIEGTYNLEVSSPGVERALVKKWHYQESIGENIHLQLNKSLADISGDSDRWGSRKKLTGVLKSVSDEQLSIDFENTDVTVPFQNVSKAHVVFEFAKK